MKRPSCAGRMSLDAAPQSRLRNKRRDCQVTDQHRHRDRKRRNTAPPKHPDCKEGVLFAEGQRLGHMELTLICRFDYWSPDYFGSRARPARKDRLFRNTWILHPRSRVHGEPDHGSLGKARPLMPQSASWSNGDAGTFAASELLCRSNILKNTLAAP